MVLSGDCDNPDGDPRAGSFAFCCFVTFVLSGRQDSRQVLKRAGMQSVHTLLKLVQLKWTGHVTRMPEERLPKKILYGELEMDKRSHGGQKKRYRHPQSLPQGFHHTNRVMGTNCTGPSKVARPHQKRC